MPTTTDKLPCPKCLSTNTQKRSPQIYCNDCERYSPLQEAVDLLTVQSPENGNDALYVENGSTSTVSAKVPAKMNDKELLKYLGVDESEWRISRVQYSRLPIARKDRTVNWTAIDGKGTGTATDSGKFRIEYVYSVKVWLDRKVEENRASDVVSGILKRLEKKSPKVSRKSYTPSYDGLMLQMMIPDIHIGRTTSRHESGENYNIDLAFKVVSEAVENMLSKVQSHRIAKVLFLMGNDFFNVDNENKTTAAGTPQQEESDFATSFLAGEKMLSYIVNRLTDVAPLDLMFIPGNHDPHRLFYLGRVAEALYKNNKNVSITNDLHERQYYKFGANLFGFTHGDRIKLSKLPALMPLEVVNTHPDWWATTRTREWHMGHFHHKQEMEYIAYDDIGVTLRFFRSLTAADRWHFQHGFVGAPKAAESLLWTPNDGLFGQYPATIPSETYVQ